MVVAFNKPAVIIAAGAKRKSPLNSPAPPYNRPPTLGSGQGDIVKLAEYSTRGYIGGHIIQNKRESDATGL